VRAGAGSLENTWDVSSLYRALFFYSRLFGLLTSFCILGAIVVTRDPSFFGEYLGSPEVGGETSGRSLSSIH